MAATNDSGKTSALETLRTSSLTNVVEKEIEQLILDGKLLPGERLNEFQLANRFGMSRGPLREAMRSLNARGLVDVVRNRGVFVRQVPVQEALEIYDLRSALFGLVGRVLVDKLTEEMLGVLKDYLQKMDRHSADGDFESYYPVNLEFHAYLVDSTGNKTLAREYRSFIDRLHLCRARSLVQAKGLSMSNYEHHEMVDALAAGNVQRAQEAFFRHVQRAKFRFMSTLDETARRGG